MEVAEQHAERARAIAIETASAAADSRMCSQVFSRIRSCRSTMNSERAAEDVEGSENHAVLREVAHGVSAR